MNSEYTEVDTLVILGKYKEQVNIFVLIINFFYRYHEEDLDNNIIKLHNTRYLLKIENFNESLYNLKVYEFLKERVI